MNLADRTIRNEPWAAPVRHAGASARTLELAAK
jgi:hypothetical protein